MQIEINRKRVKRHLICPKKEFVRKLKFSNKTYNVIFMITPT